MKSDNDDQFSRALVERLVKQIEREPLPHLSPVEHAHLLSLIQTTLEVRSLFTRPYPGLMVFDRWMSNGARWMQMDYDISFPCALSIS
jgi:hypothetical protein